MKQKLLLLMMLLGSVCLGAMAQSSTKGHAYMADDRVSLSEMSTTGNAVITTAKYTLDAAGNVTEYHVYAMTGTIDSDGCIAATEASMNVVGNMICLADCQEAAAWPVEISDESATMGENAKGWTITGLKVTSDGKFEKDKDATIKFYYCENKLMCIDDITAASPTAYILAFNDNKFYLVNNISDSNVCEPVLFDELSAFMEDDNIIMVVGSNTEATAITGDVNKNVMIMPLSDRNIDVYFRDVTFGPKDGNCSLVVENILTPTSDGEKTTVNTYFSGNCTVTNRYASGIFINTGTGTFTEYPCNVNINTIGESNLVFGTGNTDMHALSIAKDAQGESSVIKFNNTKYDNIKYFSSADQSDWLPYTIQGTSDAFNTFIDNCQTQYFLVSLTMNQETETRSSSNLWGTICYPYDGTVENGKLYTVVGRIMEENDETKLKHLVFKVRDGEDANKFEAGNAYFVRKTSNEDEVFTMTGETYAEPSTNYNYGLTGSYVRKNMEEGSYFLSKDQMWQAADGSNIVKGYRAYFPDFMNDVPKVEMQEGTDYIVDSTTQQVLGKVSDFTILGEEDTDAIMSIINENEPAKVYDLQGRKVQTPQKGGLYIINGKKAIY